MLKFIKSAISVVMSAAVLVSALSAAADSADYKSYSAALSQNYGDKEYSINLETAVLNSNAKFKEDRIVLEYKGELTAAVDGVKAGLYSVKLVYRAAEGSKSTVDYSLKIGGEYPFEECENLRLKRAYEYVGKGSPQPVEVNEPITALVSDPVGKNSESYAFEFSGKTELTLYNLNDTFEILSLSLVTYKNTPSYKEYKKLVSDNKDTSGKGSIIIEGEDVYRSNSGGIGLFCDDSTPVISKPAWTEKKANMIGGSGWSTPGETATWKFKIKESGFYEIGIRYRQDYTAGLYTTRKLYIDGVCPFSQMHSIRFHHGSGWRFNVLESDNEPYLFYLEKGEHTLSLECTLGDITEYIVKTEEALEILNDAYRRVFMITGSSPDSLRDYSLELKLPEVLPMLKEGRAMLKEISKGIEEVSGQKNASEVIFDDLSRQLKEFIDDIETMAADIMTFQSNLSSLATWINDRYNQPLDIDYIKVAQPGKCEDYVKASFLDRIRFTVKHFLSSFAGDYGMADIITDDTIEIWLPTAREKSEIIRTLVHEKFEKQYNTKAKMKMMGGSELAAIVAGRQPDVIVSQGESEPVNYAMRGALYAIDSFKDFGKISKRFVESAFTPFEFDGHIYALPETMSIPVLLYRSDIFEQLELDVPNTWDELYSVIAVLQSNNMDFGGVDLGMLLYQNGGSYYTANGMSSALDSEEAIEAFRQYTSFFSDYDLPLSYNFLTRFRSGEMPISIQGYTIINQLEMLAPEISGNWEIAPIPATVRKDGSLDRTAITGFNCCYILKSTENPEKSWDFLKWWTSADVQVAYSTRVENRLGAVERVAVSNLDALERIPWSRDVFDVIFSQLGAIKAVEQVPGGYFTSRHINNAFRQIVYNNADVRETIAEYVGYINDEITERRQEFDLPTE